MLAAIAMTTVSVQSKIKAKRMSAMIMSTNVGTMLNRISYTGRMVSRGLSYLWSAYLEGTVDSCTSVQNPQYLPGLATHVER